MRFLPIALLPLAVVGTESETTLLVPSETPRSLVQLSEVPVSSFSEYPFSDFPHSDYPFSEYPVTVSDCTDTNDDVLNALYDAFGEENCITEDELPVRRLQWLPGSDDVRIECNMKVTGFEAWATYDSESIGDNIFLPRSLELIDAYTGGSSLAQYIMFLEECLDSLEDTFFKIEQLRVERSCINEAGSFSYDTGKGKKETSCDEVSELPFKKQGKKCKKIPEIAENCPGVCRTSEWCKCIDNPLAFPLAGSKKTLTCDELEGMKEDKKEKKCKEKDIRGNCPSICKGFCRKPPYKAPLMT